MRLSTKHLRTLLLITALAFAAIHLSGCGNKNAGSGTFTDPRDKQKYRTAKIGEVVWMAEN